MSRFALAICAGLLAVCDSQSRGETFVLASGGQVEGEFVNPAQSPRESYQVRLASGALLTLDKAQVERVVTKSEAEKKYEEILPRLVHNAEDHWKMAEWCAKQSLKPQRTFHLEQVVQLDPNHTSARHALGFTRVNNQWTRPEDHWGKQGFVLHRGDWRMPQEIEMEEAADRRELEHKGWKRKLKMWREWVARGGKHESEGRRLLRTVREPAAGPALAEALNEETDPQFRMLYIESLAAMQSPAAIGAFVTRFMDDPSDVIRERCIEELAKWAAYPASTALVSQLKSKDNARINRAATGLVRLADPGTAKDLIEVLTSKHTFVVNQGQGNMQVGFGQTGGSGMSMGGGPKAVNAELQNERVLAALVAIFPGTNFGYDKQKWKQWIAEKDLPKQFNLRRDD